jgi:hypothetical protein
MKTFKTRVLGALAAIGLITGAGLALAQVQIPTPQSMGVNDRIQVIPNGQPSAQSVYGNLTQLRAWLLGGASAHSGTPALTSCGTGTPAISGTDSAGTVTAGTSATGCVVTFASPYVGVPYCVVTSQVAPGTSTPAYSVTATAITLVQASQSGNKWDYICVARVGG